MIKEVHPAICRPSEILDATIVNTFTYIPEGDARIREKIPFGTKEGKNGRSVPWHKMAASSLGPTPRSAQGRLRAASNSRSQNGA